MREEAASVKYQVIFRCEQHFPPKFFLSTSLSPPHSRSLCLTPRKNRNRFFCVRKINNIVMFHKSYTKNSSELKENIPVGGIVALNFGAILKGSGVEGDVAVSDTFSI